MSRRAPIEKDLTKAELKKFVYPAKAVADVTELKELLDCCFFQYGGEGDDDGDADDDEQQWKNFSAYCRRVGALLGSMLCMRDEAPRCCFIAGVC